MGKLGYIVIDSDHPASLARFWAAALDGYDVRPYNDAEIARLESLGLTPETDTSVMVDGPGPALCFHFAGGPRPARNRIHFDIPSRDRRAEIARLITLGAKPPHREGDGYSVLRDPEGNPFCVIDE